MKTSSAPKLSVIMPVYNAAMYLDEAIVSILMQTYTDFELIAINDGSSDNSLEILTNYAKKDKRIRVIDQKNTGIVKLLNRGIKEARGEYIARMDSDDFSFPKRFEQQVPLLENNHKVVLVMGNFEVYDEEGEYLYRELQPPEDEDIKRALFIRNPIAHGSVMLRKETVVRLGGYSDTCGPTEDLDLWMRLANEGEFAHTTSTVYRWRMNTQGLTLTKNEESRRELKKHLEKRWSTQQPEIFSRHKVVAKANDYRFGYSKHGVGYKEVFLADTTQIAAKLFTHGKPLQGIYQLLIVASTGRTGLKTALQRIHLIGQGHYNKLRRKTKMGRHSLIES